MTPIERAHFWSMALEMVIALTLAVLVGWFVGDGD